MRVDPLLMGKSPFPQPVTISNFGLVRTVGIRVAILMSFTVASLAVAGQLSGARAGGFVESQSLFVATTITAPAPPVDGITERGQAALARIEFPWESKLPGWSIEFKESRSSVLGYTFTNENRIEVYVRDSMSEPLLAHVIAHEIGHAVDVTHNSGEERREWLDARGIPGAPWWPSEGGVSDFNSGAGDFAEGFAAWQVGTGSYRSKLGPAPNSAQLELLAKLSD